MNVFEKRFIEFQFHNGSIKGITHTISISRIIVFQFHNGSIKGTEFPSRNVPRLETIVSIPQWFD